MIELNCTYEESKKILELGYDFSEICTEWQDRELSTPCIADKYKLPETACPIIPKDALEKCLPDYLYVKDFYGELDRSRFVKKLCNGMIYLNSQDSERVSREWFRTAFEAFIWCHENYPEELREKFEEVMK